MTPAFGHSYGMSRGKRMAGTPSRLSPKGWPPAAAQSAAPNSGHPEIGALSGVDGGGMCEWGAVAISLDGRRDTLLLAVVFPHYSAA